ncbi:hypothetical protein J6590_037485 [Homalodisca vitripennis]|nr:hypothetical protein J6590_037485 [Homalodisca vitripennis]
MLATELPIWDLIFVINSGFGALLLIGFPCYFGQMIEDEVFLSMISRKLVQSDNLRQAFYDYKWYEQPKTFNSSLQIMMTVATRPLRLTAGGIYPLNRETFSYIMSAFYTYVNFLLALKDKGKSEKFCLEGVCLYESQHGQGGPTSGLPSPVDTPRHPRCKFVSSAVFA